MDVLVRLRAGEKCSKPDKRTLLIRAWHPDRGYQVTLREGLVDGGKYEWINGLGWPAVRMEEAMHELMGDEFVRVKPCLAKWGRMDGPVISEWSARKNRSILSLQLKATSGKLINPISLHFHLFSPFNAVLYIIYICLFYKVHRFPKTKNKLLE